MLMPHQDRIPELKAALPDILSCTDLKKESLNSLCGACPVCGGVDRFVYKTDSGKCWCRQCHEQAMDVIDFHCWFYGKTIPDLIREYLPDATCQELIPATAQDLFCKKRGLAEKVIQVLLESRGLSVAHHAGKQSVAVPYFTLDGAINATQYLSIDQEPYQFTVDNGKPANKVFGKGDKPGDNCFFIAGPGPDQAETMLISESAINAMTTHQWFQNACCLALGGSTYTRKVNALKPYLEHITKVVVCQDNDDAGQKMTEAIYKILGDKVHSIAWSDDDKPGLDINDLLQAGQDERGRGLINNAAPVCTEVFQPKTVTANFDPAQLPERKWIVYGSVLMGHVSIIVGPGGVCKSIYTLVMCILVAARGTRSETDLIGPVQRYAKTLVINNEDDQVEMERRIAAVMLAYGIQPSELEDRFFYESGYGARRLICDETADGEVIRTPFVDRLVAYIKANGIKLIVIDPFVSTHRSSENDNSKIDDVVQIYKGIAAVTGCAIVLVHHVRKGSGDEVPTIEASRGGKALSDGCRVGEIILPLPQSDKKLFGLSEEETRDIVRMDSVKANYSRKGAGVYFKLESVKLPNGDWVGVPRRIELKEKAQDKGNRVAEIAQFMAMALIGKTGPEGGIMPWTELRASYMALADVGRTTAHEDITLIPNRSEKAIKTHVYDEQGHFVYCRVWYSKGDKKTSPILVHVEPQKAGQKEVDDDLFSAA